MLINRLEFSIKKMNKEIKTFFFVVIQLLELENSPLKFKVDNPKIWGLNHIYIYNLVSLLTELYS